MEALHLNGGTDIIETPKPEKKRRIALVGTAQSTMRDAPFDDDSWEIWTLGAGIEFCKRIDKLFEMHTQHVLEAAGSWDGLFPTMEKMKDKLILGHKNPLLPEATLYPLHDVVVEYGQYFTSSIAFMIAYAIEQQPEAIGLWGIDMMGDEEYIQQRACCEYLLGFARASGIVLSIADQSPLLQAERIYAFEHTRLSAGINIMRRELNEGIAKATQAEREAHDMKRFYEGQLAAITNLHRRYG
jgi:hypothetical protein